MESELIRIHESEINEDQDQDIGEELDSDSSYNISTMRVSDKKEMAYDVVYKCPRLSTMNANILYNMHQKACGTSCAKTCYKIHDR